jgi:predicted AlkP superfamily pyrophosphatase or phosphodiesterase
MNRLALSRLILLWFAALVSFAPAQSLNPSTRPTTDTAASTRPVAAIQRTLIISIDGLRPDLLALADAPNIRALAKRGCYSFWAETVQEGYTLPAHVSMLTGYPPDKHGVTWNDHIEDAFSEVPTIFELARKARLTTALVSGKTKFVALKKPGTLDWSFVPNDEPNTDLSVANEAATILREHQPHLLFVHLANVDDAGHAKGWGSSQQRDAVSRADQAIGNLLKVLQEIKLEDQTAILITSDHGGTGLLHGPDDIRSHYIPWIIAGPGLRKDFDLTRVPDLKIHTEDTTATIAALLGLPADKQMKGQFISDIVYPDELLRDSSK